MADNVVLVTGASTGFGRLMSVTLARRGYSVFASMRDVAGATAPTLRISSNWRATKICVCASSNSTSQATRRWTRQWSACSAKPATSTP